MGITGSCELLILNWLVVKWSYFFFFKLKQHICTTGSVKKELSTEDVKSVLSLRMGKLGNCPGAQRTQGLNANLCMLCTASFLMFEHWFCWTYQYNKYMFNLIDIYSFIHVNGCVGMGPSALLRPKAYNTVKTYQCKVSKNIIFNWWPHIILDWFHCDSNTSVFFNLQSLCWSQGHFVCESMESDVSN